MKSWILLSLALISLCSSSLSAKGPWVAYEGEKGPGKGKHIVLIAGDEEYRSEEALPMLGKILAVRHGFRCTVLFSIDPETGEIDPNNQTNIPGIEALDSADMMILALRFRELPDEAMKHVVDFTNSGKAIMGLRTATHAFNYRRNKQSPYADYDFRSGKWKGGFGQQVLGDTWISHHGHHGQESTRGIINPQWKTHPVLIGVKDIWGPTDVYGVRNLTEKAQVLVHGQVLDGMTPKNQAVEGEKNNPMMPLAWVKTFTGTSGKPSRVFCTTMGAATDLQSEGLRRLLVNACYWGVGLEKKIHANSSVDLVGSFDPTPFGFGKFIKGIKPADHEL